MRVCVPKGFGHGVCSGACCWLACTPAAGQRPAVHVALELLLNPSFCSVQWQSLTAVCVAHHVHRHPPPSRGQPVGTRGWAGYCYLQKGRGVTM